MKLIFCLTILTLSILSFAKNNSHHQRESISQKHSSWSKADWKYRFVKRPMAHLSTDKRKCQSPCKITFDARKSKAFKGRKIKSYHFNFGDGSSIVTDNPVVTHIYHGNPRKHKWKTTYDASLVVTDSGGKSSREKYKKVKISGSTEVENEAPLSSFSFAPLEPKVNEVITISSLATDDQGIVSYEWEVSDGRVLNGETVELSFGIEGLYTVTHRVFDTQGLSSEFTNTITVIPAKQNPALLMTFSGIETESFNPLSLIINATTINGSIFNDPSKLQIYLNNSPLEVEGLTISPEGVSFPLLAFDGRNTLTIAGLDSNGDAFSASIDFYAGSKNLLVEIPVTGSSGTLDLYPKDDRDNKISFDFSNGVAQIPNVPSVELVVDALTDSNEFGYATVQKGDGSVLIKMLPNRTPSTIDNDDFSQGVDGWTVTGGTPLVVDKIVKNEVIPNDLNLRIYTDDLEDVTISRSFLSKEENRFVRLDFNYVGADHEELHVILRNETTGEAVHKIFDGKDSVDLTEFFDVTKKVLVLAENIGDTIHLDVIKKSRPKEVSFFKSLSNLVINEAIAQIGPENNRYVDINSISYPRENIFKRLGGEAGFEARTWFYDNDKGCTAGETNYKIANRLVDTLPLKYLSVGVQPEHVTTNTYSLYTSFVFGGIDPQKQIFVFRPERAHLYIVQRDKGISKFSSGWSLDLATYESSVFANFFEKFTFMPTDIMSFTNQSKLSLVLEIEHQGNIFYEEFSQRLEPLSWYNRSQNLTGCTDNTVGGDKWVSNDTAYFLDEIFKVDDLHGFVINDISKLNGGKFPPHVEHKTGREVDYKTTGLQGTNGVVSARAPQEIHEVLSQASREELQGGQLNNVRRILLALGDINSPVHKVVRARCTDHNYLFKNLFKHQKDHYDHGHINFLKNAGESLNREGFASFQPFFFPYIEERKIDLRAVYPLVEDMSFIWEIRRNGETIEVIDEDTKPNVLTSGGIVYSKNQSLKGDNLSNVSYGFPPVGGEYSIHLVAVDKNDRCMTKSFNVTVLPGYTEPGNPTVPGISASLFTDEDSEIEELAFCEDEWQTYRGDEIVNPVSGHVHLSGAIVSENTIFQAGRFHADVGTGEAALICGESEIRDNYSSSNACPEWQLKEECASIYIKGTVDAQNTTFDARNGKIRVAGSSEQFIGTPLILPNDPENGVGLDENETSFDDTKIAPINNSTVTLFNVDMFGVDIKDKAFIQQSIVYKAILEGEPTILGASVFIVEEDEEEGDIATEEPVEETPPPTLKISGKSLIEGFVYSTANVEIDESTVGKKGVVSGGALVSKSLVEGKIWGNSSVDDGRVEIVDSTLFEGSKLLNASKALNKSFIGAAGETGDSGPLVWGNVVIDNGVRLSGESNLSGTTVLNGDNLIGHKVIASKNTKIDSTIGEGSRDNLFITNSQFVDASITGTPFISDSFFFRKVFVSEDPVIIKSSLSTFIDGVGSVRASGSATIANSVVHSDKRNITVTGNAIVSKSGVFDSSMYENAILSNQSSIRNTTLGGSVHVTNECGLYFGYWTEGLIVPGEGSPCGVVPESNEPALAMRTIASTSTLSDEGTTSINSEEYLKSKVSSLNKLKIKKPKKLRKNDEKLIRGIRKHEAALEKKLMSLSKSKKREAASIEEVKALHRRSLEYVEKVKAEAKLKMAR